jgi:hypothetical protein
VPLVLALCSVARTEEKTVAPPAPVVQPARPAVKPEIDAAELLGQIQYLSSEEFAGREAGTEGQHKAARYIAAEFERFNLEPAGDMKDGKRTFMQEFPFPQALASGPKTRLAFTIAGKMEELTAKGGDLVSLANRKLLTEATGGLAFAGYAIRAPELKYDDFEGLDLTGRWALILRYEPQEQDAKSRFAGKNYTPHAALAAKIKQCLDRKAAGVLIVTGPAGREKEPEKLTVMRGPFASEWDQPVIELTRAAADRLLASSGKTVAALQAAIDQDLKNRSFVVEGLKVDGTAEVQTEDLRMINLVARLPGRDERLRNEAVVVGAHYDHIGATGAGSALGEEGRGKLHPGANDNASGVAVLLETAQALGALPPQERPLRSVIFVAFTGEEKELLGSAWYAKHPVVPLKETRAALCLDMIGRAKDGKFFVCSVASSRGFKPLLEEEAKTTGLPAILLADNGGGSDHFSFMREGLPSLFFFAGFDPDYHHPSDTWEKIDAVTTQKAADFLTAVIRRIGNGNDPLVFLKPEERAFLGIRADSKKSKNGVFVVGEVTANSPAVSAGLKPGDVLEKIGANAVRSANTFSLALLDFKPGDEVELTVKRGEENLTLRTTLGKRERNKAE